MKRRIFVALLIGVLTLQTIGCASVKNEKESPPLQTEVRTDTIEDVEASDDSVEENEIPEDTSTSEGAINQTPDISADKPSDTTQQNTPTTNTPNKNTSVKPSNNQTQQHTHTWVEDTKTIVHEEKGHYETKVVEEAFDEGIYAWRTFCNKCGEDITDLGDEGLTIHSAILCESGYHADYVVVDTVHHDAVIEDVWVVDQYGYTETITSYKCKCGATK